MTENKNHNTIYFLTTLSVYIGLVIVGSSPQVLAHAEIARNSQSHSFELGSKTSSVFSTLKYKSKYDPKDISPFAFPGDLPRGFSDRNPAKLFVGVTDNFFEIFAENNQVLVKTRLPRASIDSLP